MELEQMWVLDLDVQKSRGMMQGIHRGLYKNYDWEMPEKCLSRQASMQMYYVQKITTTFDFMQIFQLMGLLYGLYYDVDFECNIENTLYDLSNFCFDHDCRFEKLLQNELGKVF